MKLLIATLLMIVGLAIVCEAYAGATDGGVAVPASAIDAGAAAPTVAEAGPVTLPDVGSDPVGFLERFVKAVKEGNWKTVGALVLVVLMLVLAKVRDKVAWFKGDRGGAVLVAILGLASGFATALISGAPITWQLVAGIIGMTWTAVGGYTWVKRIVWPKDKTSSGTLPE